MAGQSSFTAAGQPLSTESHLVVTTTKKCYDCVMDVLVVAPDHKDLAYVQPEAQALVNLLGARLLGGEVGVSDLLTELTEVPEILWFSSHGDEDGIWLSGREVLRSDDLASMLRGSECKCVFVNTCSSEEFAQRLFGLVQIPVICTIAPVPDISAYVTARGFARAILSGMSLPLAFQRSKTKYFRMIPDMTFSWNDSSADIDRVRVENQRLREQLDIHENLIYRGALEREKLQTSYSSLFVAVVVLGVISALSLALQALQFWIQWTGTMP